MNEITFMKATVNDAAQLLEMQYKAFQPLYEKYQDDETSPAKESMEKMVKHLQDGTDYYMIQLQGQCVGAVRVAVKEKPTAEQRGMCRISPIYILPECQNRGIGYRVIQKLLEQYAQIGRWKLYTIQQEPGNCHLYEKCGFVRTGVEQQVNERMTLVGYEKIVS